MQSIESGNQPVRSPRWGVLNTALDTTTPSFSEILGKLDQIEKECGVRILFACESGSRVWGFASKDSDYDVRYVYVRPMESYITITDRKDEIRGEADPLFDFAGWDITKTLRLLAKSNPSLGEWLNTDLLYRSDPAAHQILKDTYNENFSPGTLYEHYRSMASGIWHRELAGKEISGKQYLYATRALLATNWLVGQKSFPPLLFDTLLAGTSVSSEVAREIAGLLEKKRAGGEMGPQPRIPLIDDFIKAQLTLPRPSTWTNAAPDMAKLDRVLLQLVKG